MTSLLFLFLKWAMQSICLLALSLCLFNQDLVAQEDDSVPIVTPDQLNPSELDRFEPWFQPEIDTFVFPASAQFDLSTIAPLIPLPIITEDIRQIGKKPVPPKSAGHGLLSIAGPVGTKGIYVFGTGTQAAAPQTDPLLQVGELPPPIVGPNQPPENMKGHALALPLAQYPAPKTNRDTSAEEPIRPIVESNAVPGNVLPKASDAVAPQSDSPARAAIGQANEAARLSTPKPLATQGELNQQSEIPALRPTNANPTPKPNAGSDEIPSRLTLPPLAKYPEAKTKPDAALMKEEPDESEEQAEPVTEPDLEPEPETQTETKRDTANESDEVLVPNILAKPRSISQRNTNTDEYRDVLPEPDRQSATPSESADATVVQPNKNGSTTEPAAPLQITPALIVPAKPSLGSLGNSVSNGPLKLPPSGLATDENDPTRVQTKLQDPFLDEDAPAEDYPRNNVAPELPAAPEYSTDGTIMHDYQAANCDMGCCFQPQYYFLFEGVFLDRQGSSLSLSQDFAVDPFDYQLGGRFTYRSRPECDSGVELSYVGLFSWDETAARSSATNNLNSTFTPGAGLTAADFSAFNNARFHQQRFESSLHSVEYQNVKWGSDGASYTAGLRYVLVQDEFQFDSVNGAGQRGQFNLDTTNNLIGPQVGMNWVHDVGNGLSFSLKGKLGLMANINNSETRLDNNGFLVANDDDNIGFSALFEVGALAHYQINSFCRLRAGYEAWLITGIATVEDNLNSTISRSSGSIVDNGDDVFLNGFTVGLEMIY